MTKEEKINILRETIEWKPDIFKALEKLNCKVGIEIGVRKAVGATRKAIVNQFLTETVFICQLGGLIGLILGVAGGNLMAVLIDTEPVIPIYSVLLSFFGMLVVGIVFGVYPAFKASKLDPIESLRYE